MILIGVDQGTTGTRTVAFDERLEPVAEAYRRVAVTHPQPGWISKDAGEVVRSVDDTVREVVAAVGGPERVTAIGLDNEGETVVAWDPATGEPVADAVVWGCRRSQPIVDRLAAHGALVEERSGLPLDPYFSSTKIRWLIENAAGVTPETRFGTLDGYLTLRLGDGARTDPSTAARTQLQALAAPGRWAPELCDVFGVDPASLPRIGPSTGDLGTLCGLPLRAALVDQTAALAGHGCLLPGTIKATYGTGIFVLQNAGTAPPRDLAGVLPVVAWEHAGATTYALDGGVFSAGTVVDWLGAAGLGLFAEPTETEALARSVADTAGVAFLPALAGLGAPWWRSDARGVFAGLTAGATRAHLVRAALDALCFRVRDVVDAMAVTAGRPAALRVDGGLTANGYLLQRQADVLGIPVVVARTPETTALGAAALAGVGAAALTLDDVAAAVSGGRTVEPEADATADYEHWRGFAERAAELTVPTA
jgi:glycerol kinase